MRTPPPYAAAPDSIPAGAWRLEADSLRLGVRQPSLLHLRLPPNHWPVFPRQTAGFTLHAVDTLAQLPASGEWRLRLAVQFFRWDSSLLVLPVGHVPRMDSLPADTLFVPLAPTPPDSLLTAAQADTAQFRPHLPRPNLQAPVSTARVAWWVGGALLAVLGLLALLWRRLHSLALRLWVAWRWRRLEKQLQRASRGPEPANALRSYNTLWKTALNAYTPANLQALTPPELRYALQAAWLAQQPTPAPAEPTAQQPGPSPAAATLPPPDFQALAALCRLEEELWFAHPSELARQDAAETEVRLRTLYPDSLRALRRMLEACWLGPAQSTQAAGST